MIFGWRSVDDPGDFEAARERMVDGLAGRIERPSTEAAMRAIPRHEFVPEGRRDEAYADRPLPIGEGQTVSAPHMVAEMVDRLALEPGERVLEIGTGCGYHAAVTAEVVGPENVKSVEYHGPLAEAARERLDAMGYGEISVRVGDGWAGWPEHAPYDAAYLTCAAPEFPPAVVDQLRVSGRALAPIGTSSQRLVRLERRPDDVERERLTRVRFVPMQGGE
ncbi:MAG TPA: protein-L-isoaspartate(D-aspartate) O-methyltransferase [Halobacteriales archaeon]|nr:protein-L-isoaspartate(D-aspartate) O-methyltransferase [Halobacteriales archaeon]